MNYLSISQNPPSINHFSPPPHPQEIIQNYFNNFATLAQNEQWADIISEGTIALNAAKEIKSPSDEAKICAQLTSTFFYKGDYTEARIYATRCHELAEEFSEPNLYIRALYLESAIYRGLAPKEKTEKEQQFTFLRAVEIAEDALLLCSEKNIDDINLHGKIFFNLGAAHADNPLGDLGKATRYYRNALTCFKDSDGLKHNDAGDDQIRTRIRLGKVYLLQHDYESSQEIINEVRNQVLSERLAMHTDYLEAQLKVALNESADALRIAQTGLNRARNLGATEDEKRLISLIEKIMKGTD